MSIDFNFKSSAASATKQKSPPVLWSFEARHWLLPSSYESPRWHLHLLKGGYFIYIENLSLIIFISYISQLFWITCYSFCTSPCYFILQFDVMEMASFLKPHEPISSNFKLFSYSFLTSLSSQIRALPWIRLWRKGMLWLIWYFIQATKSLCISNKTVSYHLCVLWSITFNFLQELFLCIHNLHNWHKMRYLLFCFGFWHAFLTKINPILVFYLKWETCNSSFHLNT